MQNNRFCIILRENIAQILIFAFSVAVSVAGIVLLPEKIYVQIFSEMASPETGTILFLLASAFAVGLCALMSVTTENKRKWLTLESVLAIAQTFAVVYNFIVM